MTFSTKSPEANWPNASSQLEHNKRLREENAGLLAEVERLRAAMREAYRLIGYGTGSALELARTVIAEQKDKEGG